MNLDLETAVEIAARSKFENYQARLQTTEFDPEFHTVEPWEDVHEARKAALLSAAWPYVEAVFGRIASAAWDEAAEYYGVGAADVREGKQDNPYRRAAA